MGFLSFLFGRAPKPVAPQRVQLERVVATSSRPFMLAGDGGYEFEVVGESYRQEALSAICGGPCEDGHDYECEALLAPDPTNEHDPNAVKVMIEGRHVAFLARDDAKAHLAALRRLGIPGQPTRCAAIINGGWRRERRDGSVSEGSFGIELDITMPLEIVS